MQTIKQIRENFAELLTKKEYVKLPNSLTIEQRCVTFLADEPTIFGNVNQEYVNREFEWYRSQSLNVNDIPGGAPEIWKRCASPDGKINSNYGWMIFSKENGSQFDKVFLELLRDPSSRRAIMIYTRPSMHVDQRTDGMQDFCCTNTVQYFIRDGVLDAHVSMRSNDAWAGYRNDFSWQRHVLELLALALNVVVGKIYWTVGSLHFYENQFYLVDHFAKTGQLHITKELYNQIYTNG